MPSFKRATVAQPTKLKITKKRRVRPVYEFSDADIEKITKANSNRCKFFDNLREI